MTTPCFQKKSNANFNFRKSPFNSSKFSFDLYRWCVSTVATRMNNVPSLSYVDRQKEPVIVSVPWRSDPRPDPRAGAAARLCQLRERGGQLGRHAVRRQLA